MKEKIAIIQKIFREGFETETPEEADAGVPGTVGIIQHGGYYGGVYQGHKHMYSSQMIESMPLEKLETFIRGQLGI